VFTKNEAEYRHAAVNELMNLFITFIAGVMDVRKCSLMLFDENLEHMTIRSAIGLNEKIMRETRVAAGSGLSGWVAEHNKTLLVDDIEKNAPLKRKNASQYTTPSLLCVPINLHKKTVGVLNLNNKTNNRKMEREDFYLASVMAERISYLIGKVVDNGIKDDAFNLLVKEVESLSSAKEKHRNGSTQVSDLVMNIMQGLNQGEDDIKLALYASRIYDLGMTQLDESIISKSEELSEIEKKIIKTHPFPGVKLIDSVEHDDAVKRIILHHHERYDGSGYPSGLKGDSIPFISRVLAVADSYAAMVTDRPYRKAVSRKQALRTIKAAAGALFDPAVVDVFSKVV
jgi:HD-GYP domain-containing protein (c-di-GMP phosphodiesterase class II)